MVGALAQARTQVLDTTAALRDQPVEQLRAFVQSPQMQRSRFSARIQITTWARAHSDERVAVIVEARRKRFLGWSQVTADGFYKDSHGVTPFAEKDYWEHGY